MLPGGEETILKLAERGRRLIPRQNKKKKRAIKIKEPETNHKEHQGNKKILLHVEEKKEVKMETLWVREIRKLNKDNLQTTIYTTEYNSAIDQAAVGMFARWSQENFFKYMRKHFGIDDLIAYSALDCPGTTQIVNPAYRAINGQLSKLNSKRSNRVVKLRNLEIPNIEPERMKKTLDKKSALRKEVEDLEATITKLKAERKGIERHILVKDLTEEDKIKFLTNPSKQLIDTIKIVCYRAETAMALTLRDKMSRKDDARSLLQGIYKNEVDLIPDYKMKTLTVRLHHLANHASSESIRYLCEELNKTETIFPGTDLRLIYEIN